VLSIVAVAVAASVPYTAAAGGCTNTVCEICQNLCTSFPWAHLQALLAWVVQTCQQFCTSLVWFVIWFVTGGPP
jgi:hypothetical protein